MQSTLYTSRRASEERNPDEFDIIIVGLGLIGGSLARALSWSRRHRVTGIDQSPEVIRQASPCSAIFAEADDDALPHADLILLCCYPQACIDSMQKKGALFGGALVNNTCGVKGYIYPKLMEPACEFGLTFVGGYPMAEKEQNGLTTSEAGLLGGVSCLPIPCGMPDEAVTLMEHLARSVGAARTTATTPEHHDEMIAFTSQVLHALACVYVISPLCPEHPGYLVDSYRDAPRAARINETLWSELFLENCEPLTREIDTPLGHLTELRNAVAENGREVLRGLLRWGQEIKEGLGE